MRPRDALRSAARYHLRAFVPTAIGVGIAGAGLWYGLRSGDGTLLSPTALAASERAVPALALVSVGLLVAVVGRTAARIATTANLVAAEAESAQGDGIDPDDIRETVSLAVQHAVADTMDVASDQIEANVETAVSRALEDVHDGSDDAVRNVVDPTGQREVRDVSADELGERRPADRRTVSDDDTSADDSSAGDAPAGDTLADPLAATPLDGEDEEASNPLAEASRRASERMESLLDGDESKFPDETPETPSDGAEILTDDEKESNLPDGMATDDAATDDAEIIDSDRLDGGETAADGDAANGDGNGGSDADAEMVFGTDLKDAE